MPISSAIPAATSSSSRRRSGSSSVPKGSALPPTARATLSAALTEERRREVKGGHRRRGPSAYRRPFADSPPLFRGPSPGRENSAADSTSARSFSSSVLLRLQECGATCFSGRGGLGAGDGRAGGSAKTPEGGGGGGGLPDRPRGPEQRESRAETRARPPKQVDVRPSRETAVAEAVAGNAVVREGRKPLRESSTSTPPAVIPEPSRRRQPPVASRPPPAPASAPARRHAREAHDAGASSSGVSPAASTPVADTTSEVGEKFVWADKYRPRELEDFICHRAVVAELRKTVRKQVCDHFIFEGPPGVGKKTMVSAFLRDIFGPEKSETKDEVKLFELKGEIVANVQANVKTSSQHIEINLSGLHGYERHVVVSLIKGSPRSTSKSTIRCDHNNCQAIVLYDADKLSADSQHYIRWLMEKYKACFKIIFCCSHSSNLQPIKHLCKVVKLQQPSHSEIVEVLEYIAKSEGIDLPSNLAKKIADNAKQNLRQAIRSFEATWKSGYPFKENQEILTGWEEDIANIARNIVEEQSPRQLYSIREKLKNLIEHNVSPHFIFDNLRVELKKHLDDNYHPKLDDLCEEYKNEIQCVLDSEKSQIISQDPRDNMGDRNDDMRSFMTIEEFTAKFMSFYKSNVVKNMEGKNLCST